MIEKLKRPKATVWTYIQSIFLWSLGLPLLVFNLVIIVITSLFVEPRKLEPNLKRFAKQIIWAFGAKITCEGLEHLDPNKSYVYMFNHTNIFDSFFIYYHLPGPTRALEKDKHFKWPLYGLFLKRMGQIPIAQKGNTKSAIRSIEIAKQKFNDEGFSIIIAPEGTRTPDGYLGPFKKGGFHMAIDLKAEIVPILVKGMFAFSQKNSWLLFPGDIEIEFKQPIPTIEYTKEQVTELRDKVYAIFASELPPRLS